jgi:four helix bundle protein
MLRIDLFLNLCYNHCIGSEIMPKNYLLVYSEQLATDIELLCKSIKAPSNTIFQIRKSSSSVYANIREANYGQSKADMLSKFEIALKECSETEGWLQLLFNTNHIDEDIFKKNRNLCGRIRRLLISSCKTLKEKI